MAGAAKKLTNPVISDLRLSEITMKPFCQFCKSEGHWGGECPRLKITSHGTPRTVTHQITAPEHVRRPMFQQDKNPQPKEPRITTTRMEGGPSNLVRRYRNNPAPWPNGIGAWYRPQDWNDHGELVATGNDRIRAIDPYANNRAKGEPCPPLPLLPEPNKTKPTVNTPTVNTPTVNTVNAPTKPPSARADMAAYMRKRRAEKTKKSPPKPD